MRKRSGEDLKKSEGMQNLDPQTKLKTNRYSMKIDPHSLPLDYSSKLAINPELREEAKSERQLSSLSHANTQIFIKPNKGTSLEKDENINELEEPLRRRTKSETNYNKILHLPFRKNTLERTQNSVSRNEIQVQSNINDIGTQLPSFSVPNAASRRRKKIQFILDNQFKLEKYTLAEELKLFRLHYFSCTDAFVGTVQNNSIYKYSPLVDYDIFTIQNFTLQDIVIKFYFPNGFNYAIKSSAKLTMKEIIGQLIRFSSALISKEDANPDKYLAKICGLREFLYLDVKLEFFAYIRDFVKKNSDSPIEIVLVEKNSELETELANSEKKQKNETDIFNNPPIKMPQLIKIEDTIPHLDLVENLLISVQGIEGLNNNFSALNGDILDSVYFEMGVYHGGILFPSSFVRSHTIDVRSSYLDKTYLEKLKFQSNAEKTDKYLSTIGSVDSRSEIPYLLKCSCNLISGIQIWRIPKGARICLTLFGQSKKGIIFPIGWVAVNLVNFNGIFVRDPMTLRLWRDEVANPIGICGEKLKHSPGFDVSILIEFTTFAKQPKQVMFSPLLLKNDEMKIPSTSKTPKGEEVVLLDRIIKQDSLYRPTPEEHSLLWEYRYFLRNKPQTLPKILIGIPWDDPNKVAEVIRILKIWAPLMAVDALELLDAKFACAEIRAYAVECLSTINDIELKDYLLQLVQALKHEPYHSNALTRFLLNRALRNRHIGQLLFWLIKSQLHDAEFAERYHLILEAYLRGIPESQLDELIKQVEFVNKLTLLGKEIKEKCGTSNTAKKRELLIHCLKIFYLPPTFSLPSNPSIGVKGIIIEECKVMDSARAPLWLVFENEDPFASPVKIIFKMGDDLRQDMLTLEMFRIMDRFWKREGLDLGMINYCCLATGENQGLVEIVSNAKTVGSIQKEIGVGGVFVRESLSNWLKQNVKQETYDQFTENFAQSCAAYCVATYFLGIGDRHNDNIMVTTTGHLFHIDFGNFLGNIKKWAGISREPAPFILTPSFAHVMGDKFQKFVETCCRCYIIIRRNANIFMNLFAMMLSTGIPGLQTHEDIKYLRKTFCLELNIQEAQKFFVDLIYSSLNTKTTQINFFFHNLVH